MGTYNNSTERLLLPINDFGNRYAHTVDTTSKNDDNARDHELSR